LRLLWTEHALEDLEGAARWSPVQTEAVVNAMTWMVDTGFSLGRRIPGTDARYWPVHRASGPLRGDRGEGIEGAPRTGRTYALTIGAKGTVSMNGAQSEQALGMREELRPGEQRTWWRTWWRTASVLRTGGCS
jgi:hypothetical protein